MAITVRPEQGGVGRGLRGREGEKQLPAPQDLGARSEVWKTEVLIPAVTFTVYDPKRVPLVL